MKKPLSRKTGQKTQKIGQASQIMGQNEILDFFFKNPNISVTVRELALKIKLSRSTVQRNLEFLRKEGYLSADNQWIDSWFNRIRKTSYYIEKICASGVVEYLEEQLGASAIILFGSIRKGE